MSDQEIGLGMIVADRVSGFEGVVTLIGHHITGCTRYGVYPIDVATDNRGTREFFYASQLEIVDDDSKFSEEADEAIIESPFELGQIVKDEITGFEGVATVVNFKLWNCPAVCVQSRSDPDESQWYDDSRLELVYDDKQFEFDDRVDPEEQNEHNTGSIGDAGSRQLKAPSNHSA